jgi:hypothetical protein
LRLLVVVVKVEYYSVALEPEYLFQVEAANYPLQMYEVLPLLRLRLELAPLHHLMHNPDVLPEVVLVNLLIEHCVMTGEYGLHSLIHKLHLVL